MTLTSTLIRRLRSQSPYKNFSEVANRLEELDLTAAQQKVMLYVRTLPNTGTGSWDLARAHNISVTNASLQLRHLYDRGYLIRESIPQDSGGYEFLYKEPIQ